MKEILLGNLGTKAMALLLAILTWSYLHSLGVGTESVVLEFKPETLDPEIYASVTFRSNDTGEVLVPGQAVRVNASGPKGDVRDHANRLQKTFKVEIPLKAKDLNEPEGIHTVTLNRGHFTIPGDNISVEPLFGTQVRVHYVRFREKPLELVSSQFDTQGLLKDGFKVESITPTRTHILAWVPADIFDEVNRVRIRPVPVDGKDDTFTQTGDWTIEEAALRRNIRPRENFQVNVKIIPTPAKRTITAELQLLATLEVSAKCILETKSIKVELQGPEDLLKQAPDTAFKPYVKVTEADVATPGPKLIKEAGLGCDVDLKYQGKIRAVLMPDEKPENREVKITVK